MGLKQIEYKGDLCFTALVSGVEYQNYIPIFLYSIYKAYPRHHSIIYCKEKIHKDVRTQLDLIKPYYDFTIVENYLSEYPVSGQRLKALRWILCDDLLKDYKYVYNVDIDIFYIEEQPNLLDQHITHCNKLGIPVSNIFRPVNAIKNRRLISFLRRLLKNGLLDAVKSLRIKESFSVKASGLHFFETKPYFELLKEYEKKYQNIIINPKTTFLNHKDGFHNESILADILFDIGLGERIPFINEKSDALQYNNYNKDVFRPHHGLHLGIFYSDEGVDGSKEILEHPNYYEYFKKYNNIIKNDELWKQLYPQFSNKLKEMLTRMEKYYNAKKQ